MKIRSIKNVDVKDKKVLVRVDFNVPLEDGKITDDTRISAALPTLQHLIDSGAKTVLMTHLGRPEGKVDESLRLNAVADDLSKKINKPVNKLDDCIGKNVEEAVEKMQPGEVAMLENLRFYPGEESCDEKFCQDLAALGEIFVVDSFGTAHRKHASTYGLGKILPAYGGFLMEKEINALSEITKDTPAPLTIIMGGAKIETKIGLMKNFIARADYFLVGGGLANTFLAAQGFNIGESLYEPNKLEAAQEIMLEAEALKEEFVLPTDVIVADEIKEDAEKLDLPARDVEGSMKILDIGKQTIAKFEEIIANSKTIIWNGPVGLFEMDAFSRGTRHVAIAVANSEAKTVIGGGDTIDAINHFGIELDKYNHVSTGGGAMLQFLEGTPLPSLEIISE